MNTVSNLLGHLGGHFVRGLLLWLVVATASAQPSDIDIYSRLKTTSDRPNVLLVLDASANWNPSVGVTCHFQDNGVNNGQPTDMGSKYSIEMCALYNVIDRLPLGPGGEALFNVGLMLTAANPASNRGGYPRRAFVPVTAAAKTELKSIIRGISNTTADKSNVAQYALMMHEAFLYYAGRAPRAGDVNIPWDSRSVSGGKYISPAADSCSKSHIIFIANGPPSNSENADAEMLLREIGGATAATMIPNNPDLPLGTNDTNWADEYARFMRTADVSGKLDVQGIVTHGVAVIDPSDTSKPEEAYRNFVRSMATWGGGKYYAAHDVDTLVNALLAIFNELQAASSIFAAASLPVSTSARGSYLNQVFLGMFRPDASGRPRWSGNLKQYSFGLDGAGGLSLVDATGASALSSADGFLRNGALSHWTRASSFWEATPLGTPATASDAPDGAVIEKGGAAQRLREDYAGSQSTRRVYTCVGCAANTPLADSGATAFNNANALITTAMLDVPNASSRTELIEWLRGRNNTADDPGPTTSPATTVRPSIHGDVLHSRPLAINYGGSTGVVVYYGANDGQLRAVGGKTSGADAGRELWSFVPAEQFGKLKRLRGNTPAVRLSTTPPGIGALPRDYFVDGPIGLYQKVNATGGVDRAIIYVAMRRGGRQVYALDVTNPTSPRFLWKVTNGSPGMSLLGQTWSEPRVVRLKGHTNPVVVFGGGYDAAAEDSDAAMSMGNAVYALDAFDGTLLKSFTSLTGSAGSIGRSVAADIALIDSDFDGTVDRGYAVDLGGQIYRLDFESDAGNTPAHWTVHRLADLSGGTATGRKFFHAPDIVMTRDFAALMLGSGDREKPLLSATQDHFFQVFDRKKTKGAPTTATPITWAMLSAMGAAPSAAGAGCYMALPQGEKVVNAATSIGGNAYFGTNQPAAAASGPVCSVDLGVARTYEMPLFCVAKTGSIVAGGGLPPSPVSGIVNVTRADGTVQQVPFVIGAPNSRQSAIEVKRLQPTLNPPRIRQYWFPEAQR